MNLLSNGPTGRHRRRCELAWELFDAYIDQAEEIALDLSPDERHTLTLEVADFRTRLTALFGPNPADAT
jgi:hypothetical protein